MAAISFTFHSFVSQISEGSASREGRPDGSALLVTLIRPAIYTYLLTYFLTYLLTP